MNQEELLQLIDQVAEDGQEKLDLSHMMLIELPEKIGKLTPGTHIQIISEEDMRKNPPEYLLVLPWHFKHEIIERENEFLENGGKLVFPLPSFEIISKKKKF
jgi:hypothetical protein